MSNLTIENVYTRHKAKELAKKHFWKLLGMMLTVLAVTYAVMFLCTGLAALFTASTEVAPLAIVLSLLGMLVTYLVAAGLGLGLTSTLLYICRDGEQPKVSQVFSRMGQSLKAFGLALWIELKLLLWMLPGFVLFYFTTFGILVVGDPQTAKLTAATAAAMAVIPLLFMILMFALLIPAAFRYMLSMYVLADKPETGVFDCVRQSKAMMKGHKWQAFKLMVPMLLLIYGGMFALLFILMLLMAVMGDSAAAMAVIGFVAMISLLAFVLYIVLRISLGYCIFYLNRCKEQEAPAVEAETEATE